MIKKFEDFFLNEKKWVLTVDLADEWSSVPEEGVDDMSKEDLEKLKEAVSSKMETYKDEVKNILGEDELMRYEDHIQYIKNSDDAADFDEHMNDLYDWADMNDVWIKTLI